MSTSSLIPSSQTADVANQLLGKNNSAPENQKSTLGDEPTADDPNKKTPEENSEASGLTKDEEEKLMWLRREFKLSWSPGRRSIVRRVLKAFEVLKNNPYVSFDPEGFQWDDPINNAIYGADDPQDTDLYRFNNNIYQMLCLSFIAALSPEVPKTRYMPDDADNELDISTARRASTIMAIIERKNAIKSLQKQELLHLWTGGCYFSYAREVVDGDRAGTTKEPIVELVEQQVLPDRYVCSKCGAVTPEQDLSAWRKMTCPQCNEPIGEGEFYPAESMPIPTETGKSERANGMVLVNVYGPLNIDAAPYAMELYETPMLDLEVELDISAIRSKYPEAWKAGKLQQGNTSAGTSEGEADRIFRLQVTSGSGTSRNGYLSSTMVTYSRCWFQPEAFDRIDDQTIAASLKEKFPNGCKLVSIGGNEFLECTKAKLTEAWTWCGTVKGLGLYPFAVGDSALDVQERINDVANIVHEHMDRNASPTILFDADAIDGPSLNGKRMLPGTFTEIKRKSVGGMKALADLVFQPQFHVDANIYSYGENLVMLAQLVSGVQPQIFGGSDKNVQTASGQQQMLNTALGRLSLFWDQIREEHAGRAENCVKAFVLNMDDEVRNVIEGDTDSGYENEYILLTEMQGTFHAYPESDQGFPATFAEIRDRLLEILKEVDNPFVDEFLKDPDNWSVIARYIAPPDIKVPGDDERTKIKKILSQLIKSQPIEAMGQQGPMYLPSVMPDRDFDNMQLIVEMAKAYGQKHYQLASSDPPAFENLRAYLRIASQYADEAAAQQAIQQQVASAQAGAPPPGAPAGKPQ